MLFMGLKDAAFAWDIQKIILHTSVRNQVMDKITREIFNRINLEYSIEEYPWKRVISNMKNGKGDGVPFIYFRKERAEFLEYIESVITTGLAVYFSADKQAPAVFSFFSDLKPYTIGLVSGYRHCEDFENAIDRYEIKTDYAATIELNFKKLAVGRFDCFVESEILIAPLLISGTIDKTKFKVVPNDFCQDKFYFAFSKQSPARAVIPRINKVIREMKTDGTIARIMGRE
ncbi:MAG: transporter substrate-binding domain-containing protein [Desulfobacter sp.]|nr:MAG: transporter substrate-binding domain-containing protein [Desulfobacter sp.]